MFKAVLPEGKFAPQPLRFPLEVSPEPNLRLLFQENLKCCLRILQEGSFCMETTEKHMDGVHMFPWTARRNSETKGETKLLPKRKFMEQNKDTKCFTFS